MKKKNAHPKRRKGLLIALSVLLSFMAIGTAWQAFASAAEAGNPPPVGAYVDVGTYDMHYVTKGTGEAAVVFIAGSGTPSAYTDFYELQERLSGRAQTISFDHAGCGWSGETNEPRTVENLEKELTVLLDAAAPEKPIILVCHSLGSLEAIYYTQQHPDRVAGIVFLDAGDPEFYRTDSEAAAVFLNRCTALLRTVGLNRLLCSAGIPLPFYGEDLRLKNLPADAASVDKSMFNRLSGNRQTLKSIREMNENAETVLGGQRLGEIPILVLSSDSGSEWESVQTALAARSDNSRQITLANASHYLHWSNREEAANEISDFVDAVLLVDTQ